MELPGGLSERELLWVQRICQQVRLEIAVAAASELPQGPPEPIVPPFRELQRRRRSSDPRDAADLFGRRKPRLGD